MPSPKVKQGDADAHRQPDSSSNQQTQTVEETDPEPDGGSDQIEVEATGGDPDPEGGDGGDPEQRHPEGGDGPDGSGSIGGSIFGNKKIIAAVVILALIGLYLASREAGAGGSGNLNSGDEESPPDRKTATSPEEIPEALDQADAPSERAEHIPFDEDDPLAADGYVLENTSIFPSISGQDDGSGGGDQPGAA